MASSKVASQRQVLAKIALSSDQSVDKLSSDSFSRAFAQVSGGEITASVEKIYRGGELFPETLCAPAEIGDITLTEFVEYEEDDSSDTALYTRMQALRQHVGRVYFDITVAIYNCDIAEPGSERFYSRALLVGLTEADGDASSGAPATYALTFSVSTVGPKTSA